jgi:hypothetical protein
LTVSEEQLNFELAAHNFPENYPVLARPDLVVGQDGRMSILEANASTGIGGLFWYENLLGFYRSAPFFRDALPRDLSFQPPYQAIAALVDRLGYDTLAIIDTGDLGMSQAMSEYLNRYRRRGKTLYGLATEVDFAADGSSSMDGCPVDSFVVNTSPTYLNRPEYAPYWRAVRCGKMKSLTTHFIAVASSKAALTYLYQQMEQGKLPQALASLVQDLVLPSVILRAEPAWWHGKKIDPIKLAREHRDNLVVKAATSELGMDVFIGRTMTDETWQQCIDQALADTKRIFIVQEHCEHPMVDSMWWDNTAHQAERGQARLQVCPFIVDTIQGIGCRIGVGTRDEGVMNAPDFNNCSLNIIGIAP